MISVCYVRLGGLRVGYISGRFLWMAKYNYLCYLKLLGVSEWVISECIVSPDG